MRPDAIAPLDAPATAGEVSVEAVSGAPTTAKRRTNTKGARRGQGGGRTGDHNVGNVLRSVYQTAVQEDIPTEMLDLLSKLD
ncbi:hypothetical protein C1T17_19490 [Sphingobium sp. SCG-1]|nr:hypothetical protein C1T17_19490 [Sphingobium sp. SCG-1]